VYRAAGGVIRAVVELAQHTRQTNVAANAAARRHHRLPALAVGQVLQQELLPQGRCGLIPANVRKQADLTVGLSTDQSRAVQRWCSEWQIDSQGDR